MGGSITPRCEHTHLWYITHNSQSITGRSDVQRAFRIEDADSIMTHLPFVAARIALPTTTGEELVEIARKVRPGGNPDCSGADPHQIQKKANGGKDSDCKDIKRQIIHLIPPEYLPNSGDNGPLQNVPSAHIKFRNPEMHKAWRGFDNPITTRLLCPVNYLEMMKADPEGCVRLIPQQHHLTCNP